LGATDVHSLKPGIEFFCCHVYIMGTKTRSVIPKMQKKKPDRQRLLDNIAKTGDGCWEWIARDKERMKAYDAKRRRRLKSD